MKWLRVGTAWLGVVVLVGAASACDLIPGSGGAAAPAPAPTERASLLDEFLAPVFGTNLSAEEQVRRSNEENLRREELIAQCMIEAGFQYFPVQPSEVVFTPPVAMENLWRPDDRAWVEEFGYAAIRTPWDSVDGSDTIARPMPQPVPEGGSTGDPNQDFVNSLSETERQAYWDTLWGAPVEIENDAQLTQADRFALMGCWGFAQAQITGTRPADLAQAEEFVPLFTAIDEMYAALPTHPERLTIDRDWADCMAERGHGGFTKQVDAQNEFFLQLNEFWNSWDWDQGMPTIESSPELAALHDVEVRLALADLECRVATDYQARVDAATTAAEQRFISAHRTTLEALKVSGGTAIPVTCPAA